MLLRLTLRNVLLLGVLVWTGPQNLALGEVGDVGEVGEDAADVLDPLLLEAPLEEVEKVATNGSGRELEAKVAALDELVDSSAEVLVSMPMSEIASPQTNSSVFMPTEIGRRWTYVYVREQIRDTGDGNPIVEKLRGTRIDEITAAAPEFGENVVRVRSGLQGRLAAGTAGSTETSEERVGFFRHSGSSYQLVAEETTDPASGVTSLVQYALPLSLVESGAQPGQRWKVGVRSDGDLHTNLEGEVLGTEDVQTPKGLFKRCLVVRLTGQISGVVESYGSRIEVPTGDFTLTEWYAPGVGLVLAKKELKQTFVFEDGTSMEYSERTQFALRSTDEAVSPVPAAAE